MILDAAHQSYARREIEYPMEYALEVTLGGGGTENIYASEQLATWLQGKYGAKITGDEIRQLPVRSCTGGWCRSARRGIGRLSGRLMRRLRSCRRVRCWRRGCRSRFRIPLSPDEFEGEALAEKRARLYEWGHAFLRNELTELERAVLLQIYDSTWKDHLYAMDQLRESIGLLGYAEKDPRIEYKRQGSGLFQEFMKSIRDKVTDMIFKVRLQQTFVMKNVYTNPVETYQRSNSYGVGSSAAAQEVRAERAGAEGTAVARTEEKVVPIVNEEAKVGRNEACPCGSGRKYKQCCGKV